MREDGEWAGQPEIQAAAMMGPLTIVVHQFEDPTYQV
jgi:hypothetical protein